jgi:hypothetical protein
MFTKSILIRSLWVFVNVPDFFGSLPLKEFMEKGVFRLRVKRNVEKRVYIFICSKRSPCRRQFQKYDAGN